MVMNYILDYEFMSGEKFTTVPHSLTNIAA